MPLTVSGAGGRTQGLGGERPQRVAIEPLALLFVTEVDDMEKKSHRIKENMKKDIVKIQFFWTKLAKKIDKLKYFFKAILL